MYNFLLYICNANNVQCYRFINICDKKIQLKKYAYKIFNVSSRTPQLSKSLVMDSNHQLKKSYLVRIL